MVEGLGELMARRAARKRKPTLREDFVDATPERLAKDRSEFVNPALIDSGEQQIGLVRRIVLSTKLDRLHRNGRLEYHEWHAGDWYRQLYERCHFSTSVISSYGERTSAGEPAYGLPRTAVQAMNRVLLKEARDQFPTEMRGYMDRFLLHDALPRYGGNQYHRNIKQVANALDKLSIWLTSGRRVDNGRNTCL